MKSKCCGAEILELDSGLYCRKCQSSCFTEQKPADEWEKELHNIFFTINTPEVENIIFNIEQEIKQFISTQIAKARKEGAEKMLNVVISRYGTPFVKKSVKDYLLGKFNKLNK